jgi:hypothetical protein
MIAPIDWPVGVPAKLTRAGYTRTPQDVVQRLKMDAGPPLRRLIAGAAGQSVKGTLAMTRTQADVFEAWYGSDLDRGLVRFNWNITDNGAAVVARFASQPKLTRQGSRFAYGVEIDCAPASPSLAQLAALAAIEDAGPGNWPASVPFHPLRSGYAKAREDGVLRSPAEGPHRQALVSRADGSVMDTALRLTTQQLADFEAWFAADAAFGLRDTYFPAPEGGQMLGHFQESYKVAPSSRSADWQVTFKLYLEAVQ